MHFGARLTEAAAAAARAVPIGAIRTVSRGQRAISAARMLGMYLAHVTFSMSLTEVGRIFGRDRTTARHACARIEDERDHPQVERSLQHLEPALRHWSERFARRALETEDRS
jgi:chromosomal replication initiation ATPase DnaA